MIVNQSICHLRHALSTSNGGRKDFEIDDCMRRKNNCW